MFTYSAIVERVIDGDTIDVHIDLGFDIWHSVRLRLAGIDAPERFTEDGKIVTEYVRDILEGQTVIITTTKTDKYGRYLADVILDDTSVSDILVKMGYAVPYDGGKRG